MSSMSCDFEIIIGDVNGSDNIYGSATFVLGNGNFGGYVAYVIITNGSGIYDRFVLVIDYGDVAFIVNVIDNFDINISSTIDLDFTGLRTIGSVSGLTSLTRSLRSRRY